ncbi:MAG: NAD-dependent epimerase/dehydratase family protein [bacterium]|nr:NAD-dependent epimerase/dehydratase family protein [bacterium]
MKNKKRVLVLGASGFLGYNIFNHLSKREDLDVHGTYLENSYGRLNLTKDSERLTRIDLTKEESVQFVTTGYDVVIQMAACSTNAKDALNTPYIQVTPNMVMNSWLFQAAFDNKVGQVIFPSCTVMYQGKDTPYREGDADFDALEGTYDGVGCMKMASEKFAKFFARLGRTKFTAIRHSNIYGPHDRFDPDRSHVFGATIRKVLESKDGKVVVWGQGKEVRDFLYVDDFVRFVEMVIDQQDYKFDVFNLGSDHPIKIGELVQRVIDLSGKNLEIVYDPSGPTLGTKISIDSSKAKNKFFWNNKTSLGVGISKTIDWYRQNILKEGQ